MTYVVVDTNSLIRDYRLTGGTMQAFLLGCMRCHIQVYFPEVVLDELFGNFGRDLNKLVKQVTSLQRKLTGMSVRVAFAPVDVGKETDAYKTHVHHLMEDHCVESLPYPDTALKELVAASYSGQKPFKETGEGYKDYLIFQTLKSLAEKEGHAGYLITANYKDFCDSQDNLHPNLKTELPPSSVITVLSGVQEFVDRVLKGQLGLLDDIAQRIRGGTFEGFDLEDSLTNLFISELCDKYHPLENSGTPLDEPTTESVASPDVDDLEVSRLADNLLLFELSGKVVLELSGFIAKRDFHRLGDDDWEEIYVSDPDWNEWVSRVTTSKEFHFSVTVVFNTDTHEGESVTLEIAALEDT